MSDISRKQYEKAQRDIRALQALVRSQAAHLDRYYDHLRKSWGREREARGVLRQLFGYIEDGTLVRAIQHDGKPGWILKMATFVMTLKRAQAIVGDAADGAVNLKGTRESSPDATPVPTKTKEA